MAATLLWLLGKDLKSLDIFTGLVGTSGTIAWTTAGTITKKCDYVRVSDERMLEMIQSVDGTYAHYEKTLMDSALTVGEILKKSGNVLPGVSQTSDLIKVVFTRTYGTATSTYTYTGIIRNFQDGFQGFGKQVCELTLAPYMVDETSSPLTFA